MHAFTRLNLNLWLRVDERLNLFGEDACGIDDVTGVDSHFLITKTITYTGTTYLPLLGDKGSHLAIVGDRGTVLSGSTNERHREAGIMRLRIIVDEAFFQSLGKKVWCQLQHSIATQMMMPFHVASSCQYIVEPEPKIENRAQPDASRRGKWHAHRVTITLIDRQDKCEWMHQEWGVLQQKATLDQSFMHQSKIKVRYITNASVDELCCFAARAT